MAEITASLARDIKLVILDVDGVLTDNGVYIGGTPDGGRIEMKRFDILDGLGIHMLRRAEINVAFVSGRESPATLIRAAELGVDCYQAALGFKLAACAELMEKYGVAWEQIACVCDDLADIPVLKRAGLPVAVANAVPEVRAIAKWITTRRGGEGAVREFAEELLRARAQWDRLVEEYVAERT